MKSIALLLFTLYTWTGFGQTSENESNDKIGSATLIHKPGDQQSDRWEISFHDRSLQKQLLWLMTKSPKNKPLNSLSYRIRKKPFGKMGMNDMLAVATFGNNDFPVKKGKVKLEISSSRLILEANLKINGLGTKRYSYEGRYKIIESR